MEKLPFLIIVAIGGGICILSSVYEWTWWWRLGGIGKFFYNRFGHQNTRLYFGLIGILLVASVVGDIIKIILSSAWGKILFTALVLLALSFISYMKYVRGKRQIERIE